jgi:uncharacterized lipoprotein YmbA
MRALTCLALAGIATLAGCRSPRERLYTLSAAEPPATVTAPTLHVALGPVTIPAAVDRPELVVRYNAVRVVALEQERWAESLREAVPRVLADSITGTLHDVQVTTVTTAAPQPDLRVSVDVTRFEAIAGREVIIEAHWRLRSADTKTATEGTSVARVPIRGGSQDYDAIVAAEAAALSEIGVELARVLEKEAGRHTTIGTGSAAPARVRPYSGEQYIESPAIRVPSRCLTATVKQRAGQGVKK